MGAPAADVTSLQTCPMVTVIVPHVCGPVCAPGAPTVLAGALPVSCMGSTHVCVGPPGATLPAGAVTVLCGGKSVNVVGDPTAHGGAIVAPGAPTVLFG
ncbi:MAG: type VI secretion protein [Gammaproteobacteria bacterium RIFCSPHIGHO2_12_FULL_45_9]|nr:MAG: type VI secretion protein [Gammaproteobacteria bacterium RIFCSPHIGHO2_12_FULL_45_9]